MHELYVCQALIGQVETVARENKADHVQIIHLGIGPLSGIEPRLLEQAFFIARSGTLANDAELVITSLPVRVSCNCCGHLTDVLPTRLVCGDCGDWKTQLISGDELQITRVELTRNEEIKQGDPERLSQTGE